ncbi:3,4-dihydroxy-2-butanone 4-phosphate synthase [Auriscalpium vulgare]|uniref:3,4-dihydroxy-2-butanone 4-phosphate synthase n=1 Tax=Auriscalpium vulgare TaxID=40419 RepID=A0ACB8R5N9_9AGAM|nr:3,4-dihydroxy-2-butanone 4-phosphate synthase [Auriscalpium vulgare]
MAPVAITETRTPTMSAYTPEPTATPLDLKSPARKRPREHIDVPARTAFAFDDMEDAIAAFERGEFLVVMDDEGRENEGDLIVAASGISTEQMAWMIRHTSGYICISLPGDRLEELDIPMMVPQNEERHRTAYTVTVDYKHGTTTGISAHDRALTARALAEPHANAADFTRPGHLVPLRARTGGTLVRRGHTESALDLCALAGLPRAGLLCELVSDADDGHMLRRDGCREFADRWGIRMISVEMIAAWRRKTEAAGQSEA